MLIRLAFGILRQKPFRSALTCFGIATAVFLSMAQLGLMVGWCNTVTAIIRNAHVDIWIMAEQTPAFDYGTGIPRHTIYSARSVPGVRWAEGMFMGWNYWQRPDGRRANIELIGLDDSCVGGPWKMQQGNVSASQLPETVIVDELFLTALGVKSTGDETEIFGKRARVGAISQGVRTMTAAPFVFTSIATATKYDRRSSFDDVTYVLVRCDPGRNPTEVRDAIRSQLRGVEVLTTWEFASRSMRYWMLETGIGITVVVTAILGLAVAAIIISQTLFTVTQEQLPNYAVLLALGFSRAQLLACVLVQAIVLGGIGILLGSAMFYGGCLASSRTPIPLETTSLISGGIIALCVLTSLAASYLALKSVLNVNPVSVFRA